MNCINEYIMKLCIAWERNTEVTEGFTEFSSLSPIIDSIREFFGGLQIDPIPLMTSQIDSLNLMLNQLDSNINILHDNDTRISI